MYARRQFHISQRFMMPDILRHRPHLNHPRNLIHCFFLLQRLLVQNI